MPIYQDDDGNDFSDLGISTSSTSGKSSLSEDYDNQSVTVREPFFYYFRYTYPQKIENLYKVRVDHRNSPGQTPGPALTSYY